MASTAGVSPPLKLRFIFANHDGVVVEYTAEPGTLVKDLKTELADKWPSAVEPATDLSHVRLICMGFGILPDAKSLAECRIPHFDSHPTPVNVSIRPKDVKLPQSDGGQAAKQGQGGGAPNQGCCAIA